MQRITNIRIATPGSKRHDARIKVEIIDTTENTDVDIAGVVRTVAGKSVEKREKV